jgi:transposase
LACWSTAAITSSERSSRSCPVRRGRRRSAGCGVCAGVDTLTAVGLCAEVGDFERFAKAGQLMSYLGLVPSESTTGNSRRLGSITKTGSAHARRLLVEAARHYRKAPATRKTLTERQAGQPPEAIAIAWTAQRRLHRTWTRLEQRSKRRTIIAVAAARELVGFCWAITHIE